MSHQSQVILTNMCLIEDDQNRIVMQIRDPKRYSWSGAALPGGHIEEKESLHQAVVREVYEETGLTIHRPRLVGMKHWYTAEVFVIWSFFIAQMNFQDISAHQKKVKLGGWRVKTWTLSNWLMI